MSSYEDIGYGESSRSWTFTDATSRRPRTATFQKEFEAVGDRVWVLLSAAKRRVVSGRGGTIHNAVQAIRYCCKAIARYATDNTPKAWCDAVELHLQNDSALVDSSRWGYYNHISGILKEVARHQGVHLSTRNPFKRKTVSTKSILQGDDLRPVIAKARQDALATVESFKNPNSKHIPYISAAQQLLVNGLFFVKGTRSAQYKLARRWRDETGLSTVDLTNYLYPSAEALMPFLILLGYNLAANPDSLSLLRRSGVEEFLHPNSGAMLKLTLDKPRAGEIPEYLVPDAGTLSSGWLVRAVLEMTNSLVEVVEPQNRDLVFLCGTYQGQARAITAPLRASNMKRYLRNAGLPSTTLKSLRRARANDEYEQTGDPFRVQRLLAQSDASETIAYLNHVVSEEKDLAAIAGVQKSMLKRAKPTDGSVEPTQRRGKLPGHTCLDPRDPPKDMPTDEHGFCLSYLWPFNDVHFILLLEPRPVAMLLRDYQTLCEAEKVLPVERFNKLYAARKRKIELDFLPLIDDELHSAAMKIVAELPATFNVESM